MPVFLFLADTSKKDIYFVPVKTHIRNQFDKLNSQDTITFVIAKKLRLSSKSALGLLRWYYYLEKRHSQFSFHITNLISQADALIEFIQLNQN